MILYYLRITLRRFDRQRFTTLLHLIGLSLGMSVCLLIALFLRYELSFDTYHEKADRTYRINSVWAFNGEKNYHYSTPMPIAEVLRTELTGLETVAQWHPVWGQTVVEISPEKRFNQEYVVLADPELLDVFDIEVLQGNGHEALRKPYQALLTESTAEKFFGREDPMGKTFKYRNDFTITVAGIIRDLPANTHMPASMLISFFRDSGFLGSDPNGWTFVSGTSTFVVLPENADPGHLDAQLKSLADKYLNSDPNQPKDVSANFDRQALSDIHYDGKYAGGSVWAPAVNTRWLWFFGLIGMAVLALACINFINLSTAQALSRAREVGIRKSVGAGRRQLVAQFLGEAWSLAALSGVLAVMAAHASLPYLNQLADKKISFQPFHSPDLLLWLALGVFLTGLVAGLYPAWVIARFNPVNSLKTGWSAPRRGALSNSATLRKGLVVAQFSISVGLLIALVVIAQQVHLLRTKNLGFDKENIINVPLIGEWGQKKEKLDVLAGELRQIPSVSSFSFSTAPPSAQGHWTTNMSLTDGKDPSRQEVTMILADEHFCPMYDLQLLTGRFLESADTSAAAASLPPEQQLYKVVVNENCAKALGFASPEDALGKQFWYGFQSGNAEIVGVVADFNVSSLHETIKPTLITQVSEAYNQAGIKIEANSDLPQTLAAIESAWEKTFPLGIFSYEFLDEQIGAFYQAEARLYRLFQVFSAVAMLISCLGLWGLATFAARQRTKEIGVRKVFGASVAGIVALLSKDFMKLVGMALLIASGASWYFMNEWLQGFAYRIEIQWWVFALAGVLAIGIAFLTVSFQSIKAALANPVDSLRNE